MLILHPNPKSLLIFLCWGKVDLKVEVINVCYLSAILKLIHNIMELKKKRQKFECSTLFNSPEFTEIALKYKGESKNNPEIK